MNEQKPNDCAIWKATSKNGTPYLSVQVTIDGVQHKFACFTNDYKTTEMHPDYKSMKPRETQAPRPSNNGFVSNDLSPGIFSRKAKRDAEEDELPF